MWCSAIQSDCACARTVSLSLLEMSSSIWRSVCNLREHLTIERGAATLTTYRSPLAQCRLGGRTKSRLEIGIVSQRTFLSPLAYRTNRCQQVASGVNLMSGRPAKGLLETAQAVRCHRVRVAVGQHSPRTTGKAPKQFVKTTLSLQQGNKWVDTPV